MKTLRRKPRKFKLPHMRPVLLVLSALLLATSANAGMTSSPTAELGNIVECDFVSHETDVKSTSHSITAMTNGIRGCPVEEVEVGNLDGELTLSGASLSSGNYLPPPANQAGFGLKSILVMLLLAVISIIWWRSRQHLSSFFASMKKVIRYGDLTFKNTAIESDKLLLFGVALVGCTVAVGSSLAISIAPFATTALMIGVGVTMVTHRNPVFGLAIISGNGSGIGNGDGIVSNSDDLEVIPNQEERFRNDAFEFGKRKRADNLYRVCRKAFEGEVGNENGRIYLLNCLIEDNPSHADLIQRVYEETREAA